MPSKDTKTLKFNYYQKSDEAPSITNADLESLIEKWMYVKIILKNNFEQKEVKRFHQVFQCLHYCDLKT